MRALIAGAIVLSLTGVAYAQSPALNLGGIEKKKDPLKEMKDQELDRAYRDATQGGKGAAMPASNDPWGSVRGAEQPAKSAPKAAAAKPKAQAKQAQSEPQAQPQSAWPAAPKPQAQSQSQSPWPAAPTQR